MSNVRDLRPKREDKLIGHIQGIPDAIAERPAPKLRIDTMQAAEMRNTMQSIQAMAQAQLKRFDAAGVVVMIFDASGTSLMTIERPARGGVTDDYIREACARVAGVNDEEG